MERLKILCRRLKSKGYNLAVNKGLISKDCLSYSSIFVLMLPRETLTTKELQNLDKYTNCGGRILVTGSEGKNLSNINIFLKKFGMEFRNDSVIRTLRFAPYHYPKEALILDSIANAALSDGYHGYPCTEKEKRYKLFPFIYPFGCSMDVQRNSVVLLSTGNVCYPFSRPVCAFYQDTRTDGRIIAIGSTLAFTDDYIRKENNLKLVEIIFHFLTDKVVNLSLPDVQCPDISDYALLPNIADLSDLPYSCLQNSEETSAYSMAMLQRKIYQFDNRHVSRVLSAYKELNMMHEKLKIIKPKFEAPLPDLRPALIPPRFRGLSNPGLEMFDLDDFFMSQSTRLSQLTNKCTDDDLEYYIRICSKLIALD
ncbi:Intraflagellar transport protein 52-like protein, partial [Stegodyphus mimosarum]